MTKSKQLLFSVSIKDCDIQPFRGSGAGGQKRNKTSSGIRVVHPPSGATGMCTEHREQSQNKKQAFLKMIDTSEFKTWHRRKCAELVGKPTVEEIVEEQMQPKNLYTEVKDENGAWVKLDGEPKNES